jgi:hypothetical protein
MFCCLGFTRYGGQVRLAGREGELVTRYITLVRKVNAARCSRQAGYQAFQLGNDTPFLSPRHITQLIAEKHPATHQFHITICFYSYCVSQLIQACRVLACFSSIFWISPSTRRRSASLTKSMRNVCLTPTILQ